MAWQSGTPWKTSLSPQARDDETSFPGLTPASPEPTAKIEYDELQQNELLALEAIYGEDFTRHTSTQSAWKKTEPAFDIRIKAPDDEDFNVLVGFVMTATYPKSPPLLSVKDDSSLAESSQFKVQRFLETEPRKYAKDETEMIDRIVEGVREILQDAAQAKALGKTLPSLVEERERQEADLARQAQEQQEAEKRKKQENEKEEERIAAQMLEQEVQRQRRKAKESKISRRPGGHLEGTSDSTLPLGDSTDFEHPCNVTDNSGNTITFSSVTGKCEPRQGLVSVVYSVRPVIGQGQGATMALKESELRASGKDLKDIKKQLQTLESRLQDVKAGKRLQHRHLVEVIDFKVQSGTSSDPTAQNIWTVSILSPMAEKGSLEELLELAETVDLQKVRSWTRDLLDALNFLHNKNIAHQDLHPGNVLLFREPTGEIIPKISDAWYQRDIHNIYSAKQKLPGMSSAKSTYWLPPEIAGTSKPQYNFKTDIWDFGVVFAQMVLGLDVLRKYTSPRNMMESLPFSQSLRELLNSFFKDDKQKRPRPFELGASEFLATDASILVEPPSGAGLFKSPSTPLLQSMALPNRGRRESLLRNSAISRYAADFVEEGRLGKGGFGEVVKARKKLDGGVYAIKKITQSAQTSLTEVLKEVHLLSQISHPAVVRYYNTWTEEVADATDTEGETSTEDYTTEDTRETGGSAGIDIQFATSTGGLDFMSSNAGVEFEYEDDESDEDESEEETEEEEDSSDVDVGSPLKERQLNLARRARFQRPGRTVLYISMEYCEKRTLRDVIGRGLHKNTSEIWRLFRQVLEGLSHIHSLSIVHRDLKPENIFISSSAGDVDNVKIGDFGLATSGQFSIDKSASTRLAPSDDMTRSIGTAYYSAPEVRSTANVMYSTKVDMYSLGIIFFEMCYLPMMGMQKADVIGKVRMPKPILPPDFKPADKIQTDIVLSLVHHNPNQRPTSNELLQSGKMPIPMENETIRRTLAGLADSSSPYHRKMLSTLFERANESTRDYAWDMSAATLDSTILLNQGVVKKEILAVFRRHGALETPRGFIYPRSSHYGDNVFQVLDQNGAVLQLPFDLTLGHARLMAKNSGHPTVQRTFSFGTVFRDKQDTGQPMTLGEVDYDIVTADTLDLALKEAEVLKVLDEIIATFPSLYSTQMCFHVGHSDLLHLIFEFCGVEMAYRRRAADALSKLNIHNHTWQRIRLELRSPEIGLSATSVDDLQKFDFRDTPNKAFSRLKALFEGSDMYQRASSTLAHLKEVYEYSKLFGVGTKFYVTPLNSLKESFYVGGILFSCLYDKKVRDVFAAGGRYDHLIKEQRPKIGAQLAERHAVGFNLAWEKLAKTAKTRGKTFLKKTDTETHNVFSGKRCDILVASFDPAILRSSGIDILQTLWSVDISAELAKDARSPEDLMSKHRDDSYYWIITIKQDGMLKIKTMDRKEVVDVDIHNSQLISWLRGEIRERDSRNLVRLRTHASQDDRGPTDKDHDQNVKVLIAQTKSKKFNRRTVVEQAQASAASLVQSFLDGPVLAVETTDQVMEMLRQTALSEPESWRKVEHDVTTSEKKYVREIHDQLDTWRHGWLVKGETRHAFLYNFRTSNCLYYDLGA